MSVLATKEFENCEDSYKPVTLIKAITNWSTRQNLNDQLRTLNVGDKIMLTPENGTSEKEMSFIVHDNRVVRDASKGSILLISESVLFDYSMHIGKFVKHFENSTLYKLLNTWFKSLLPQYLSDLIVGDIRIPTAGMVFGQENIYCGTYLEMDSEEQLQSMSCRKNRIAENQYGEFVCWWLANKVKDEHSPSGIRFACVDQYGGAGGTNVANKRGVRPAFWIRYDL